MVSMDTTATPPEKTSMEQTAPKQNTLLGLPRELRDLILDHVLIKRQNQITMLMNFGCFANEISACAPEICAVNRQLRAEALPAFYSGNIFTAQLDNDEDLETAKAWLTALGNENVRHLRRLLFNGWTRMRPKDDTLDTTRRWIKVTLDLQAGSLAVEGHNGPFHTKFLPDEGPVNEVEKATDDLKTAFSKLVEARNGQPWDSKSIAKLMDGFNTLCTWY